MGSPAMTTRGLDESDFSKVVGFLHQAVEITRSIQTKSGSKKVKDFKETLGNGSSFSDIVSLKKQVVDFAKVFPTIGF